MVPRVRRMLALRTINSLAVMTLPFLQALPAHLSEFLGWTPVNVKLLPRPRQSCGIPVALRQPHRLRDWDGDQHSSSCSHRARGQTAGRQRSQFPVRDLLPSLESGRSRTFRRLNMRRARTGTSGAHHPVSYTHLTLPTICSV